MTDYAREIGMLDAADCRNLASQSGRHVRIGMLPELQHDLPVQPDITDQIGRTECAVTELLEDLIPIVDDSRCLRNVLVGQGGVDGTTAHAETAIGGELGAAVLAEERALPHAKNMAAK